MKYMKKSTAEALFAFSYLSKFDKKDDVTFITGNKFVNDNLQSDTTFSGNCVRHKNGTFTITKARRIKQYATRN